MFWSRYLRVGHRLVVATFATMCFGAHASAGPADGDKPQVSEAANVLTGSGTLRDKSFEVLTAYGQWVLKNVTISEKLTVSGSVELEAIKAKEIIAAGELEAEDLEVQTLQVSGDAEVESCQVAGDCTVSGNFDAEEVTVKGLTQVSGKFETEKSTFQDIEFAGRLAEFDHCTLGNLRVSKQEDGKSQKIVLKETKISGDVTFVSGNGIIILEDDSQISGAVTGGKVQTGD